MRRSYKSLRTKKKIHEAKGTALGQWLAARGSSTKWLLGLFIPMSVHQAVLGARQGRAGSCGAAGALCVVIQPCAVSNGHPSEEAQGPSSSSLAHLEQSPHSRLCFGAKFSRHHHTKSCLQRSSTFPYSHLSIRLLACDMLHLCCYTQALWSSWMLNLGVHMPPVWGQWDQAGLWAPAGSSVAALLCP